MNYYKAITIDTLPKLIFELVATSVEQLEALGLDEDGTIVPETWLTDDEDENFISYEFGICHKRTVDGEIVDRPIGEIDDAQDALTAALSVLKTREIASEINYESFTYDGKVFPMTPGATIIYQAIFDRPADDHLIAAADGTYTLAAANIDAFKAEFYDRIIELNNAKNMA